MKKMFYGFCFLSAILVFSCSKSEFIENQEQNIIEQEEINDKATNVYIIGENNGYPKQLTTKEVNTLFKKTGLGLGRLTCGWSDGLGGTINCTGGTCTVYSVNANEVGVGCRIGNQVTIIGVRRI